MRSDIARLSTLVGRLWNLFARTNSPNIRQVEQKCPGAQRHVALIVKHLEHLEVGRYRVRGEGSGGTCLFLLSNRSHCYVSKAEQHNAHRREEELLDLLVDVLRPRKRSGEGTSSVPNRTANSPSEASVDAAHLTHIRRLMRLQQKHMQESHPRQDSKVV